MEASILFADGEAVFRQYLRGHPACREYQVIEALDRESILDLCKKRKPDIAIIGSYTNNPQDGLKLARLIRRHDRKIPVILIARKSSEALAIAALKIGVNDYVKISSPSELLIESIKRLLAEGKAKPPEPDDDFIGTSQAMREIKSHLARIAAVDSTILITGETGTGKELAAEYIHRKGQRAKMPFVCVNCAAIPEGLMESEMFGYERGAFTGAVALMRGKFETAQGGTILLDEIADMSPHAQAKILRTIEGKELSRLGGGKVIPLDVRVTAATNREPERLVEEGKFREDLFYRLNVARVHLPPLRDRKEDIPGLVEHAIGKLNRRFGLEIEGLTDEALSCLVEYQWPGNVRELLNLLEASYANLPNLRIAFMDLPIFFRKKLEETRELPARERDRILSALFEVNWNKTEAARKLHWSRTTLYRKIEKYHIHTTTRSS